MNNTTACSNCEVGPSPTPPALVGWVLESKGRGTLGLITTCLATILLCTWVVIHPRVYQHQSYSTLHKLALFSKTVLAPEFIAVEGLQEWAQCRRMTRTCARLAQRTMGMEGIRGIEGDFKLIHAFYISMFALRYRTPMGNRVIWPSQYTWLLEQSLVDWSKHRDWDLCEEAIRDKSKSDSAAKLLAVIQASWFVAQCIMRGAHALPLSQLESMTLGYIPLFLITYFFWWNKPKDIRSPSIVELPAMSEIQRETFESMAVSNTFDGEGMKDQVTYWNVWYLTPRVFEKEQEDKANATAARYSAPRAMKRAVNLMSVQEVPRSVFFGITHAEGATVKLGDLKPRALDEISHIQDATAELGNPRPGVRKEVVLAHWDPDLYMSNIWLLICLFGVSFPALHLASWNTVFPTTIEMWLWRGSAFVSIVSMLAFMHFEKVVFRWGGFLTIISIVSPAIYFLSRLFMMAEAFAALRAEDPAIYDTYEVANYWLHLI